MKINYIISSILGYNLKKAEKILNKTQSLNKKEFLNWQNDEIIKILHYHIHHNKYYKKICKNNIKEFKDAPILTKKDFQIGLQDTMSISLKNKSVYKANTSGASGQPFWFVKDKNCHSLAWSYILDRYATLGNSKNLLEARFFGSIRNNPLINFKERCKDILLERVRFDVFDQSFDYFEKITIDFAKQNFTYIYGYTNSIYAYALHLEKHSTSTLKEVCKSLTYVLVTAEMCNERMRKKMIKIFGVPVYREYGSSETSIIAIENKLYEWEIASQRVYVEIVDQNGNLLPDGCTGKILVTDFYNYAMPIIRYDIGDEGSIVSKNKFPFFHLNSLQGRESDTIFLPSGKSIPGLVFYYILRDIIEREDIIKRFIIKQRKIDTFVFEYIAKTKLDNDRKQKFINTAEKYLEPNLIYEFLKVDIIPLKPSGKIQHFFSDIN